jgi:hypothetical protein
MPTAKKNASSVAPSRPPSTCGATAAPITTYDRCHAVHGGCRIVHQSRHPSGARRVEGRACRVHVSGFRAHITSSTQTHRTHPHVDEAGVVPRSHRPIQRVAPVVHRDVRPEEPSDAIPRTTAGHIPRYREHAACVEPPPGAPEPTRGDSKLEARDRGARFQHPRQLAQRRGRILDVAQEIRECQRVERRVRNGQTLGSSGYELHAARDAGSVDPRLSDAQHRLGQINTDDMHPVVSGEIECDARGAGCDVEYRTVTESVDMRDHLAPPATVLPERQQFLEQVVPARKWAEQLLGEAVEIASSLHRRLPATTVRCATTRRKCGRRL